jgi:hypothetical protein
MAARSRYEVFTLGLTVTWGWSLFLAFHRPHLRRPANANLLVHVSSMDDELAAPEGTSHSRHLRRPGRSGTGTKPSGEPHESLVRSFYIERFPLVPPGMNLRSESALSEAFSEGILHNLAAATCVVAGEDAICVADGADGPQISSGMAWTRGRTAAHRL